MSILPPTRLRVNKVPRAITLSTVPIVVQPSREPALAVIDAAIMGRVLVYGALPPLGSDVDLLASPRELAAMRGGLQAAGFVERRGRYARFGVGEAEVIECAPTSRWKLSSQALGVLFAEASPLPGMRHLVVPSPRHVLLIRARKAAHQRTLTPHMRMSIRAAEEADPQVWAHAREDAGAWHARAALTLLEARYTGTEAISRELRWRTYVEQHSLAGAVNRLGRMVYARFARLGFPPVVAFSGLDGAGKTFQATQLLAALTASGQAACIVWKGVGRNRLLGWTEAGLRRLFSVMPGGAALAEAFDAIIPEMSGTAATPATPPRLRADRSRSAGFAIAMYSWASLIAVTNVLAIYRASLRAWGRRRLLIYDRYVLDSVVKLLYWYGDSPVTRLLTRVISFATPKPLVAYLLDLPPEVAYQRKAEWGIEDLTARSMLYGREHGRLGARRLDATLPADDLCARVAAEVWGALG